MHTYSEQFLLLAVDPVSGRMFPVPDQVLQLTLAGALLIDASFDGLINDDWEQLTVMKFPESGNTAVDGALRSHDQFNTSVFGLNDRYRGISNERRVLSINNTCEACETPAYKSVRILVK